MPAPSLPTFDEWWAMPISEHRRIKEEFVVLAMAHAAMRGVRMRAIAGDQASAERLFAEAQRMVKKGWTPALDVEVKPSNTEAQRRSNVTP